MAFKRNNRMKIGVILIIKMPFEYTKILSLGIIFEDLNLRYSNLEKEILKKYSIQFIALLFVSVFAQRGLSQIYSVGEPIFNPVEDTNYVPQITVDYETSSYGVKSSGAINLKNNQFAEPIEVDINPELYGVWIEVPELNKRIWLLKIKVEDASSLNLVLKPFELLEGVKLFFYDSTQVQVLGAITSKNNKVSGVLPIAMIHGEHLYCEMQLPMYQTEYGAFTISKIGAGYPLANDKLKSTNDSWYGSSQYCQVNVNCYDFAGLENLKNAVCRIVYQGSSRCTGTLLNNLNNDATPYILTAGHCINIESYASEAIFYFNYESPDCEDSDVEPVSISGASLVAAGFHVPSQYDSLDFSLLQMSETPPLEYGVYYAGWDATGSEVDSVYSLHHPEGDLKKICIDRDGPQNGGFGHNFDDYTHWWVADYEDGSTEPGSSGAGLFDPQSRLIGSLSGGKDACSEIIDDFYQMFSASFDNYEEIDYQLKNWLDPNNTGVLISNGFDPSYSYRENAELLINFTEGTVPYIIEQENGYGYLAGHNYQENRTFVERYEVNGSKYLNGVNFYPAMINSTSDAQYFSLIVMEGGDEPGELIFEESVLLSDYEDLYLNDPSIAQFFEFDSSVLVSNDFYVGIQITYSGETFALSTFTVGEKENTALTFESEEWKPLQKDGEDVYSQLGLEVYAYDLVIVGGSLPDTTYWEEIHVYPNPSDGDFQMYFQNDIYGELTCDVYNLHGQIVSNHSYYDPGKNMLLEVDLEQGMYILHFKNEGNVIGQTKVLIY